MLFLYDKSIETVLIIKDVRLSECSNIYINPIWDGGILIWFDWIELNNTFVQKYGSSWHNSSSITRSPLYFQFKTL